MMGTIGEDMQVILGLVPIRDRAGIARGTMADAAAVSEAKAAGPRPPQFQIPPTMGQTSGPPASIANMATPEMATKNAEADFTLPDNVRTEYTAGSGGGRAMSPVKPLVKQPLPPPTPEPAQERVIASSPAAAPSPAVIRNSDVLLAAYEKQQRAARLQSIFSSIGGMVGSLRGENVSSGGGGGGGGPDLNTLKTIMDMRKDEDQQASALQLRKQGIDELQRMNNWSPERAAMEYDSGGYKDTIKQDTVAKREEAKRAGTAREALLKPEVVDALSKRLGQPPEVVRSQILNGSIGPKDLADIEHTQSTTASQNQATVAKQFDFTNRRNAVEKPEEMAAELSKMFGRPISPTQVKVGALTDTSWTNYLQQLSEGGQGEIDAKRATAEHNRATAEKERADTAREKQAAMSYDEAKADPVEFARRHPELDTPAKIAAALENRGTYEEYGKKAVPNASTHLQEWTQDELRRKALGLPSRSLPDFVASMQPKHIETPEEKASGAALTHTTTKFYDDRVKPAEDKAAEIRNAIHPSQDMWTPDMITGSGNLSDWEAKGRRVAANLLGYSDQAAQDTQIFFNERKSKALEMRAKSLPGALSDGDREFLLDIAGNKDMSPDTLRRLLTIQEKYNRSQVIDHNEEVRRRKADDPATWKHLREVQLPDPGRFVREDVAKPRGQILLKQLYENPDNPQAIREFDKAFGKGLSAYYLAHRSD